jgi:CRP-like cAMP-binding protein
MTEFEPLYSKIKSHLDLSDEETAFFVSHFETKKVKKRQFIVQPNYIAKHRNFVVNGAFRSYAIGNDGQENTINLAIDDW